MLAVSNQRITWLQHMCEVRVNYNTPDACWRYCHEDGLGIETRASASSVVNQTNILRPKIELEKERRVICQVRNVEANQTHPHQPQHSERFQWRQRVVFSSESAAHDNISVDELIQSLFVPALSSIGMLSLMNNIDPVPLDPMFGPCRL